MSSTTSRGAYTAPPRGGHYQNVLLAVLFATFGFVFFDRMALNYLAPYFMDELGLDNTAIGLLGGLPSLTWAISGLLLGVISDRIDRRKPLIIACIIGFSIFSALSGLVGGLASLLLLRAIMGMAEGGVLPLSQTLLMYSSSPKRRGLNMGLLQGSAAGLLGGVVGPIVTVAMANAWGWRSAFYITIVPGIVLTLLVLFFVKDLCLKATNAAGELDADAADAMAGAIPLSERPTTFRAALKTRNMWLCMGIAVFFVTWFITTQTFSALFLSKAKGFDAGSSSLVLTGIGIGWVVWGGLVPALSDRIGRKPAIIIFASIAALAPLAMIFIDNAGLLFVVMALTYTGMGCFTLFMATIPAETVAPQIMASCLGLIMGLGEILGGFVAPTVAGMLADRWGLNSVMIMCTLAACVVVVLAFFLRETAPRTARSVGTGAERAQGVEDQVHDDALAG
ncbi:MFS transporter [Galactobacter valiniphilus]|uniref:MFS transporter n=1 Tax=Galactobacter valiniphilus TaxID=2676122 RepID=UPI003737061E